MKSVLNLLGYYGDHTQYNNLFHLSETEVLPIRHILYRGTQPHLMIMEMYLFSLADFKSEVRKTENFERNYLLGKYGAVPIVEDFGQQYLASSAKQNADEQ